jgi:hypothetical protein
MRCRRACFFGSKQDCNAALNDQIVDDCPTCIDTESPSCCARTDVAAIDTIHVHLLPSAQRNTRTHRKSKHQAIVLMDSRLVIALIEILRGRRTAR